MHERKLVSSAEAAAEFGVSERSLTRWRKKGWVVADLVTPGGQLRWDVEHLRRQLAALRGD